MTTSADEQTRLLHVREGAGDGHDGVNNSGALRETGPRWRDVFSIENRLLLGGFLISLSFCYTQVPLFYALRLMACDDYYTTHPPHAGPGDRCSTNAIGAYTSSQYALIGVTTSICGVLNLVLTGGAVKRFGPRLALMCQIFIPNIRVLLQIFALETGGRTGIIIFQATQLITVLGGPLGYNLVINIMVGEIVEPIRRTIAFGKLTACIMLGMGTGYYVGSLVGDMFGIVTPFQVSAVTFLVSNLYILLALPYIAPDAMSGTKKDAATGFSALIAPFKVLRPQRVYLPDGRIIKHYGVRYLCAGVFLGSIATNYVAILVQMYAAQQFDFSQSENGVLMSGYFFLRFVFLMFVFPGIISAGRRWYITRGPGAKLLHRYHLVKGLGEEDGPAEGPDEHSPMLVKTAPTVAVTATEASSQAPTAVSSSQASTVEPSPTEAPEEVVVQTTESAQKKSSETEKAQVHFDLLFLQTNLVLDGILTTGSAYATEKWHLYLADFILPLGSGSAPAAKGVITEMCPPSQRADALSMLQLSDNIAQVMTLGFFGLIFSALTAAGKPYLTFFVNAAVAMVGAGVLMYSHFPPLGSELVEDGDHTGEQHAGESGHTGAGEEDQ